MVLRNEQAPSRRERILLYGAPGTGKSWAWVSIAEWLEKTKSPGKVILHDTDIAWDAMRPVDGRLDDRVIPMSLWEWGDYKAAMSKAMTMAGSESKDDWLVVDLVDKAWDAAQEGFFERAYGAEIDEFYVNIAHNNAKSGPKNQLSAGGEYGANWNVIKKMYQSYITGLLRWPGHVLCCAAAAQVHTEGVMADSDVTRREFGGFGWKPAGEKNLPHLFHTVLLCQRGRDNWTMSVAKDRNREVKKGIEVDSFVTSYLFPNGWRP